MWQIEVTVKGKSITLFRRQVGRSETEDIDMGRKKSGSIIK